MPTPRTVTDPLNRLCSFQEDFVVLQSPLCNNGNQGQQAIILLQKNYKNY